MLFAHKAIIERILDEQGPQEEGADLVKIRQVLMPTVKGEPASFPEVLTSNKIYNKLKGETAWLLGYYDREYPNLFNDSRLRCLEAKISDEKELFAFESKIILARRVLQTIAKRTKLRRSIDPGSSGGKTPLWAIPVYGALATFLWAGQGYYNWSASFECQV